MNYRADLWVAALAWLGLGLALAFAMHRTSARAPNWMRHAICAALTGLLLGYGLQLADSAWLARLLPVACLPVCGNLAVPLALPLCALLLRLPVPAWRRRALAALLGTITVGSLLMPLLSATPSCTNRWDGEVCLQTSLATCSAAAATTLLRHAGIPADEAEMARLCLTTAKGTTLHGLCRGLILKTRGTSFRVRAARATADDLESPGRLPAIVSVALTAAVDARDVRYSRDWGWRIGVSHAVVVLAFAEDDRVRMADPSVGEEHWRVVGLRDLMTGDSVWLEPR